jgi:hypothetical protein
MRLNNEVTFQNLFKKNLAMLGLYSESAKLLFAEAGQLACIYCIQPPLNVFPPPMVCCCHGTHSGGRHLTQAKLADASQCLWMDRESVCIPNMQNMLAVSKTLTPGNVFRR